MKTWMQHILHPLHLWSRFGKFRGQGFWKFYEAHIWQPFLRPTLKQEVDKNAIKPNSMYGLLW